MEDDPILQRIANRLASAAAIPEIRHTMNVEDEIFSELEDLDTKVLMQKKQLAEKDEQLAQQGEQLAASIRLMLSNGIPKASVAEALGI